MVFSSFHREDAKFAKEEKTLGKTQASGERKLPDSRELRNQILESYGIKFSRATESNSRELRNQILVSNGIKFT